MKQYGRLVALLLMMTACLLPDGSFLKASNEVTFEFRFSGASKVKVYGSFNSWSRGFQLQKSGQGKWKQTVELNRGRYEYKFLVDGKWRYDSSLPSIDDGLYSRNNVIIVR